jgi:hypothetical protein
MTSTKKKEIRTRKKKIGDSRHGENVSPLGREK